MRHLHRDYNTTHCGIDASHVLMTHVLADADCADCLTAHTQYVADEEARAEAERQAELERQQFDEERLAERVAGILSRTGQA